MACSEFYFSPCSHIINTSRLWFIEAVASISSEGQTFFFFAKTQGLLLKGKVTEGEGLDNELL